MPVVSPCYKVLQTSDSTEWSARTIKVWISGEADRAVWEGAEPKDSRGYVRGE